MTAMEHCDDTVKEHCDEKDFWSIVMKGDKEHCDDMGRELCDNCGLALL